MLDRLFELKRIASPIVVKWHGDVEVKQGDFAIVQDHDVFRLQLSHNNATVVNVLHKTGEA